MNIAILEERRRARRRRNDILTHCRVWFPAEPVDFGDLHNPEISTDLRESDPYAYDAIVCRGLDRLQLH
jgi:hypothetical protein